MAEHPLQPGLYEALLTGALDRRLADLVVAAVAPELRALADAEAADRLSRHFALVVTRALEALPEHGRAQAGAQIISRLIELLSQVSNATDREVDLPLEPVRVLSVSWKTFLTYWACCASSRPASSVSSTSICSSSTECTCSCP